MTVFLVGHRDAAAALLESLSDVGLEASVDEHPTAADKGEIAVLAEELLRLESALAERRPAAVLLADTSDRALAAALVATKLLIPVAAVDLDGTDGANARLLAQLADRKLSAEPGEIRAWTEALPRLV
jgi:hypothetical protein